MNNNTISHFTRVFQILKQISVRLTLAGFRTSHNTSRYYYFVKYINELLVNYVVQ